MFYITFINGGLIVLVVLIHYEMLNLLDKLLPHLQSSRRFRLLTGVFGALTAHVIEVWLFAFGYWVLLSHGSLGSLDGNMGTPASLFDCVYFSLINYTTLGIGDIVPNGNIRFLAGLEALVGLLLITWSASFLFLEMQRFWRK